MNCTTTNYSCMDECEVWMLDVPIELGSVILCFILIHVFSFLYMLYSALIGMITSGLELGMRESLH